MVGGPLVREKIREIILGALRKASAEAGWNLAEFPAAEVEIPREKNHGDFATNLAMTLAKPLRSNPRKIAETLRQAVLSSAPGLIESVEIAGPGFLNFRIKKNGWLSLLDGAVAEGKGYGRTKTGAGKKVLLEFVSANPTGPLHVGHARIAAVGDALARILSAAGYVVTKEFYVNDTGLQMQLLARSILVRYQQHLGREAVLPEDHYQGEYVKELAARIAKEEGEKYLEMPESAALEELGQKGCELLLAAIGEDLSAFGLVFDAYYSEKKLYKEKLVEQVLGELQEKNFLEEKDKALWFKSTNFGDEKDRVVRRENGIHTYFASDIAYHRDKYKRGFDLFIDIWGADHHGYIPRVKAAITALGLDAELLKVQLVQFVNLLRGGERVAMGKRSGTFDTLRDLIDEVGSDAARFIFLLRSADSTLDFDLDLAKKRTLENPVFYVQYAHARIHSFFAKAREVGLAVDVSAPLDATRLVAEEEIALVREISRLPEVIATCARGLEAHPLPHYLLDLARTFHSYYTARDEAGAPRFKAVDPAAPEVSRARLKLAWAVALVLRNGLECLGVSAPERMESAEAGTAD